MVKTVSQRPRRQISERKQAEQALQAEKNKLQSVVDAMEYGLTIQDRDYNIIYQNELFQRTSGDQVGEKCYRAYESRDRTCDGCPVEKAFRDGKSHTSERKVVTPSGEVTFWEHTANPIRDASGKITSCLELTRNITEQKRAEDVLQAEKNKLQSVVDAMEYGLTIQDRDYNIIYQNEPLRAIFGDRLGDKCYRAYEGKDKACDGCPVEKAFRDGKSHTSERRVIIPSGEVTFWENTANPIRDASGKITSCLEIARNVTERKQAEEALRESEERSRSVVENSHAGIMILDDAYHFIYANDELCRISGYSRKEIMGQDFRQFLDEESQKLVADRYIRRQRGEEMPPRYEFNFIRKGGQKRRVEISSSVIRDSAGAVRTLAQILDITERKRAEEALRESEEKLQRMFESVTDGVIVVDLNGVITETNQSAVEMHGFSSRDELLGKSALELVAPRDRELAATNMRKALKQGTVRGVEYTLLRADGSEFPGELGTSVLRDASGKWVGHITIVRDVSERKRAEDVLQAEKNKLQSLVDAMEYALNIQDREHNILYMKEPEGIPSGGRVGDKCYRAFEGGDKACEGCPVEKAFRDGKSHTLERRVVRPSGEVIFWENTANPIRDASGKITSCLEISRNITERKQADEALRESEEKYKTLFESTIDGLCVIDAKTMKILLANETAAKLYGFDSPEEAVGRNLTDFVAPEERQKAIGVVVKDLFQKDLHEVHEWRTIAKDGKEIWVSAVGARMQFQGGLAGLISFRDITEHKQAEEELKLRAQILDGATDSIFVHDLDDNFIYVNEAACRTHGYSREEFMKMKLPQMVAPERVQGLASDRQELLGKGSIVTESAHLRKDGSIMPVEIHARTIETSGGKLFLTVARDITERKQAEEELKLRVQMLDGATDSIFVHDLDENFVYVNEAACRTHGYSREEFLGMKLRQIIVPEKIGSLSALRRETLGKSEATFETAHLRKDGSIIPLEVHSRTIESGGQKVILAVMRDITARKKAEEEEKRLQQELYLSRRLSAIGELAAGVAHEINNPLTGVLGFSQRLLRKSTSEAVSRDLEIIHDEAQRAADIVQNLLTFARRRGPRKEYSDINDIMQKALELRSYALQTGNIEVTTNLAPSLPKVMVDFPQIQEVFLNIILNAEQAMNEAHGGGKLIIKTRQIKDYVRISFADDGPGIPPEQLDKVFDPFFTTREGKGGTGLGLSVCHGIVTGHGGKIYARSKPAKGGVTFFVELPLTPVETPVGRRF